MGNFVDRQPSSCTSYEYLSCLLGKLDLLEEPFSFLFVYLESLDMIFFPHKNDMPCFTVQNLAGMPVSSHLQIYCFVQSLGSLESEEIVFLL